MAAGSISKLPVARRSRLSPARRYRFGLRAKPTLAFGSIDHCHVVIQAAGHMIDSLAFAADIALDDAQANRGNVASWGRVPEHASGLRHFESLIRSLEFPIRLNYFPVPNSREFSCKPLNWLDYVARKSRLPRKITKFPVLFPVIREFALERGSQQTASTTIHRLSSPAFWGRAVK
jgi:hypothetical protein